MRDNEGSKTRALEEGPKGRSECFEGKRSLWARPYSSEKGTEVTCAERLDTEATGRAEDDPALTTSNVWTAPPSAGTEQLWLVLRDLAAVDFAAYSITVQ